jgi:Arc/MetJ-type ribon-helix-helix transcriptional regulator
MAVGFKLMAESWLLTATLVIPIRTSYNGSYTCNTRGIHMKTITVRLDDGLVEEMARLQKEGGFHNKSDVIREGLKALVVREQHKQLKENLARYLLEHEALAEAARQVEGRMSATEEALKQSL